MSPLTFVLPPLQTGEGGYTSPGIQDFVFDGMAGWWGDPAWLNKPLLQAIIAAVLIIVLWLIAARRLKLVPSKGQFFAEQVYDLVRNGIARDMLGPEFRKYLPYLLALFCFLLVNNWFGVFAPFMFPTFSNIGYAWAFAIMSWVIYIGAGIAKHGFFRYMKMNLMPTGVPLWLAPIIIPIEFLSNFIVPPLTNLFAGHLVVLVFVVGGSYLLLHGDQINHALAGPIARVAGGVAFLFSFAILALEILIGALQAYIFTVLTAAYVQGSIAEEH